jgi:hypothetical protein
MGKPTAMKVIAVLTLCALCAAAVLAGTSGASATNPTGTAEADTRADVLDLSAPSSSEATAIYAQAMHAAEQANDPTPESIEMTVTTMGSATELIEGGEQPANNTIIDPRTNEPWGKSAVYAVELHGGFRLTTVQVPKGHQPPNGSDLTLLIDRQLDKIVGAHVSDKPTDLHALGTSVTTWGN